jgi:hypothetical protein
MKGNSVWAFILGLSVLTLPAQGGVFNKKPATKVDPMMRVPQLLYQVKMDPDEKKRVAAAEELRDYDCNKFTEVVPFLIDVLQGDKSPAVRTEVAHTLSRIRPVSLQTAQALENTTHKDAVMRVRMQAWTGLRMIHISGAYPQAPKDAKPGKDGPTVVSNQVKDPSAGNNPGVVILPYTPPAQPGTQPVMQPTAIQPVMQPTTLQPVMQPTAGKINQAVNIPRPLPSTSSGFSTAIPNSGQRVNPPPTAVDDGPALGPPPPRN